MPHWIDAYVAVRAWKGDESSATRGNNRGGNARHRQRTWPQCMEKDEDVVGQIMAALCLFSIESLTEEFPLYCPTKKFRR